MLNLTVEALPCCAGERSARLPGQAVFFEGPAREAERDGNVWTQVQEADAAENLLGRVERSTAETSTRPMPLGAKFVNSGVRFPFTVISAGESGGFYSRTLGTLWWSRAEEASQGR